MGLIKVTIAFVVISTLELITKFKDKQDERCFEIAMSILFAGWIISGQW